MQVLFKEKILPDLSKNIVCGNSLIGTDIYDGKMFPSDEERKINAMNFEDVFPEIMKNGGFDAIVGNPPYLKLTSNNIENHLMDYYKTNYKSLHGGSSKNLFQLFIEKVVELNPYTFSYIIPEAVLTTSSNNLIREFVTRNYNVDSIVKFNHFVFQDANIGTVILVASKQESIISTKINNMNKVGQYYKEKEIVLTKENLSWDVSSSFESSELLGKIEFENTRMKNIVSMSKGMVVKDRKDVIKNIQDEKDLPFLLGNCMSRYNLLYKYFAKYDELTIIGGTKIYNRHIEVPRLLIRRTGNLICATYSENPELVESTIYILTSKNINLKYLLGVLNSRVLTYYLRQKLITNVSGYPQILMGQLDQLPIKVVNFLNESVKQSHDKIVQLVDQMLEAKKQLQKVTTDKDKTYYERRCETLDRQIDQLVYELYGLTEEEIKIVEGKK
jgi:adenine-specific DNA-methyltransferase